MAQIVKNLPAMQETQVQSLGWEDPLEKGMAAHSNILSRKIPWTEEPSYRLWGHRVSDTTEQLTLLLLTTTSHSCHVCNVSLAKSSHMAKHKADRKGNLFLPKGRRVDVSEQ